VDEAGSDDIPGRAEQGAAEAAMRAWNTIPGSPVRLVGVSGGAEAAARLSWWPDWEDQTEALAVTIVSYEVATGRILDAEIRINDEADWSIVGSGAQDPSRYDVQNTVTHEIGHAFGLAHAQDRPEATMYPSAATAEILKRDLDPDDVAGFGYLYLSPAAGPEEPTPSPRSMGCSLSGTTGGDAMLILLVLGTAIGGRRRRALGILLSTVLAGPAQASAILQLELSDLVARADTIVQGRVEGSVVRWVVGSIYTDTSIRVSECMAGTCSSRMIVRQRGGEIDGIGQSVEGTVQLSPGQEVILFLRRDGRFHRPVGMARGVFYRRAGGKRHAGPKAVGEVLDFSIPALESLLSKQRR